MAQLLDSVFEHLKDPDVQDPDSGLMTFPAYVYVYPPDQEYALRKALPALCDRLRRPNVRQDPLLVNIYEAFLDYLRGKTLGGASLLDMIVEAERDDPDKADRKLREHAGAQAFVDQVAGRFAAWAEDEDAPPRRSYVFVHGWGSIHPYLRASRFLDRMERHLHGYKLILFYPGTYEGGQFRLFGRLTSKHVYRASCLNEMIAAP